MTRKRNTAYDKPKQENTFVGYVQHTMTKAEHGDFEKWSVTVDFDFVVGELERLIDSQYKFSIKHDNYGGGVQSSLMCSDPKNPDFGLCLTGRAPDFYNAVLVILFKHKVLFAGEWFNFYNEAPAKSQWG